MCAFNQYALFWSDIGTVYDWDKSIFLVFFHKFTGIALSLSFATPPFSIADTSSLRFFPLSLNATMEYSTEYLFHLPSALRGEISLLSPPLLTFSLSFSFLFRCDSFSCLGSPRAGTCIAIGSNDDTNINSFANEPNRNFNFYCMVLIRKV